MTNPLALSHGRGGIPVSIKGRIQGRFREDSRKIREDPGNMRGRIQGTSERKDSKNIQGTFREQSREQVGRNQGGIREESGKNQGRRNLAT